MTHMASVGIRELQQHATAVIARAKAGETVDVTERGRLVARLVPVAEQSWLHSLSDAGQLRAARAQVGDLPPARAVDGPSAAEVLAEMRSADR